jgi:hypothetical protein
MLPLYPSNGCKDTKNKLECSLDKKKVVFLQNSFTLVALTLMIAESKTEEQIE